MMNRVFVMDLDGCCADDRHRHELIDFGTSDMDKRYAAYHAASIHDQPIEGNMRVLQMMAKSATPLVITSRSESARTETVTWLSRHAPFSMPGANVLMRPVHNHDPSPMLKQRLLADWCNNNDAEVVVCFDDREDVLKRYRSMGLKASMMCLPNTPVLPEAEHHPSTILYNMAETFAERSSVYGNNLEMVVPIINIMFPNGVPEFTTKWHLFELLIMKLTRFAVGNLEHPDSIHDLGVYAAMIESQIMKEQGHA